MEQTLSQLKKHCLKDFSSLSTIVLIGPLPIQKFQTHFKDEFGIIFIDGGKNHQKNLPKSYCKAPSISLGDGDSLDEQSINLLDYQFSPQKDLSDLGLALQSIPNHISKIFGLGLLGGDFSHQLANLGEIFQFLCLHQNPIVINFQDEGQGMVATNYKDYQIKINGRFSVFSVTELDFQITGHCRYNCPDNLKLGPLSSRGLSNVGTGLVNIKASEPFFLIINE